MLSGSSDGKKMATVEKAVQLAAWIAHNATPRLRLVCKELRMEGYSRIPRSALETMLKEHWRAHPDRHDLMIGLLSGNVKATSKSERRGQAKKMEKTGPLRVLPKETGSVVSTVVHRFRHDRPKEAHFADYPELEQYAESGEVDKFWGLARKNQSEHRVNVDIVFFINYKMCEFNIYQNQKEDAHGRLLQLKDTAYRSHKYMCMALRLEHWFVRKYQGDRLTAEAFSTLSRCTQHLLTLLHQHWSYLSHYDEGDAYYNLAVIEPDDAKAQQYFHLSAEAFKRAECTNEAQRSYIRMLQRITRRKEGEPQHWPEECWSSVRQMLPPQFAPQLVTDDMRSIISKLQSEETERTMLLRTKVAFRMAVSDVRVREGLLAEAKDQAKRALRLCQDHPWSEKSYAQERIDNICFLEHHLQPQLSHYQPIDFQLPALSPEQPPLPTLPPRPQVQSSSPPLPSQRQLQPLSYDWTSSPSFLSTLSSSATLGFMLPLGSYGVHGSVTTMKPAMALAPSPQLKRLPTLRTVKQSASAPAPSSSSSTAAGRSLVPSVVVVSATPPPTPQPPPPTPVCAGPSFDLEEISPFPDFLVAHLTLPPKLSPPCSPTNRRA